MNNIKTNLSGIYIEIEKKYLLTETQAKLLEQISLKAGFSQISSKYEKNQNFDRDNIFEKDDARLRLRTKMGSRQSEIRDFEFTYKKRLGIENGIKKETELSYYFTSNQDSQNLIAIFGIIGLTERDSYERIRKTFSIDQTQLTIDEFPFGYVAEIEGTEDKVIEYEKSLGMDKLIQYDLSCDDLYLELCKKKGINSQNHILFDDRNMPRLDEYIPTWNDK